MSKPVRYFVKTEKNPKGYTFHSIYNQYEKIIERASKRNDKVTLISTWSTSTGKFLGDIKY